MAQFDVYRNPSARSRDSIPYVVDVQSDLLGVLSTRLTFPLADSQQMSAVGPRNLCPVLRVQGRSVRVLPHLAAAFHVRDLGRPIESLLAASSALIAALDALVSGV